MTPYHISDMQSCLISHIRYMTYSHVTYHIYRVISHLIYVAHMWYGVISSDLTYDIQSYVICSHVSRTLHMSLISCICRTYVTRTNVYVAHMWHVLMSHCIYVCATYTWNEIWCNTLQHTATHCNTLQHTATHWHVVMSHLIYMVHMCHAVMLYLTCAMQSCCISPMTYISQVSRIMSQRPDWGVYSKRGRQVCIASSCLLVNFREAGL